MLRSYSPLRYPGGKAKLYSRVKDIIQVNFENKPVYVEGYAGGAGLAMKLLLNNIVSRIYINDLDRAIYSFWFAVLYQSEPLIERIRSTEITIEEWHRQKNIYLNPNATTFDLAFATLFLNRTNRSGIISAGPIGGYEQLGNYKIDCRFNKENVIKVIQKIHQYNERIVLTCLDGKDFIRLVDNQEQNAFIYLDPPYVKEGKNLYKNSFNYDDHVELSHYITNLNNKWFVTYDEHPLIEEIYKNMKLIKYEIGYTLQTKRSAREIIIHSENLVL